MSIRGLKKSLSWAEESREQSTPPLPHAAFETHTKELLGLNGKLHRELIDDILGIAIDDEVDGVFGGDAALVAIEELVFTDFRGRGFVLHNGVVVVNVDVRERVRSAFIAQQE